MKIGVLSDTHLREPTKEFRRVVEQTFRDADRIFHLGDFVDWTIAEYLSNLKELVAVCGNMDPFPIQQAFPQKRVVEIGGFRIGLIHGGGAPFGIEKRIRKEFESVEAIVYGHTHTPANHNDGGVLFFNPGSPTRSFWHKATIGILHITDKIEGEIVSLP
ncbi:MAG: metallophosphatase family protein [Desulfobacterota bacterium]|nr:metallophosphatase family protein [Thermodesulfobacteriota bacterium]